MRNTSTSINVFWESGIEIIFLEFNGKKYHRNEMLRDNRLLKMLNKTFNYNFIQYCFNLRN